jgi:hypothetical protein
MGKYFYKNIIPERSWDSIFREINAKLNGHVSSVDVEGHKYSPPKSQFGS